MTYLTRFNCKFTVKNIAMQNKKIGDAFRFLAGRRFTKDCEKPPFDYNFSNLLILPNGDAEFTVKGFQTFYSYDYPVSIERSFRYFLSDKQMDDLAYTLHEIYVSKHLDCLYYSCYQDDEVENKITLTRGYYVFTQDHCKSDTSISKDQRYPRDYRFVTVKEQEFECPYNDFNLIRLGFVPGYLYCDYGDKGLIDIINHQTYHYIFANFIKKMAEKFADSCKSEYNEEQLVELITKAFLNFVNHDSLTQGGITYELAADKDEIWKEMKDGHFLDDILNVFKEEPKQLDLLAI